jgi:hypothetical protein
MAERAAARLILATGLRSSRLAALLRPCRPNICGTRHLAYLDRGYRILKGDFVIIVANVIALPRAATLNGLMILGARQSLSKPRHTLIQPLLVGNRSGSTVCMY